MLVKTNSVPQYTGRRKAGNTSGSFIVCEFCGKTGHSEDRCWQKHAKRNCSICEKRGHEDSECHYRGKIPKQRNRQPSQRSDTKKVNGIDSQDAQSGKPVEDPLLRIVGFRKIASYNWIGGPEMTILTPGKLTFSPSSYNSSKDILKCNVGQPPKFTPLNKVVKLKTDGAAGLLQETLIPYPLEPTVRAILHSNPSIDCSTINVVACPRTMRQILDYIQSAGRHKAFRIRADRIGNTLFLTRPSALSEEEARDTKRYERSYIQANTSSESKIDDIGTHHQIVQYGLGDLKIMTHYEVDAFMEDKISRQHDGGLTTEPSVYLEFDATTAPDIHATPPNRAPPGRHRSIPQSALLRIETAVDSDITGKKCAEYGENQLSRLWFRQVFSLAVGLHTDGKFNPEKVQQIDDAEEVRRVLLEWEQRNQDDLKKLIWHLEYIAKKLEATPSRKLELSFPAYSQPQYLPLAPDTQSILPKHLEERWRGTHSTTGTTKNSPAQPAKTFSGPMKQPSILEHEDMVDPRSISGASEPHMSGQAATVPVVRRPPICRPPAKLATTFTIARTESAAVTRKPAVPTKSTKRSAIALLASNTPVANTPVANTPVVNTPAASITTASASAANKPNAKLENTPTVPPITSIKDHPNYTWLAPACLFGMSYTIAVLGVVIGFTVVVAIYAAAYGGYVLCATINNAVSVPEKDVPILFKAPAEPINPPRPSAAAESVSANPKPAVLIPESAAVTAPEKGEPVEMKPVSSVS